MLLLAALVLNHVSVIDVARGVAEADRAVEIEGTQIHAVLRAKDYRPPAGIQVVNLPGRYLMPGFVDMHAHVLFPPLGEDGRPLPSFDRETALALLRTLLFNGITTVRDPGDATEAAVAVRGLLARGVIVGPPMLTAGRILTTAPMEHAIYVTVTNEKEVREEVDWQADVGVDFIKLYQDLPPRLVRAGIDEAHRRGLRVIGHLQSTTWTDAARMGIDFIAHAASWAPEYLAPAARAAYRPSMFGRVYWLEHVDPNSPAVQEMITALVEHHVSVDPTLMAFRTKFWGDDFRYTNNPLRGEAPPKLWAGFARRSSTVDWTPEQYRAARAQWPKLLALVKLMHDRGVLLTVGTDTPFPWIVPGASFHEELRLLASAGIPVPAVLRMATLNAAQALKLNIGSIEPGKDADLVVLSANPLESLRNTERIEIVVKAGKIFKPER
ncbi:MAG TPA: amidohydrolase family protein [Candidatus Limnocylindrales bacterium]|nr:amidohydrolase family protein [Candidatus Limnocylindrales bacterium]